MFEPNLAVTPPEKSPATIWETAIADSPITRHLTSTESNL